MTTLVTGATGLLGSAVARALLDAGHAVRVLVRPHADTRNLDGLEVERATGDLTERRSLEHAAQGCDTLFHVAADYRLWIPDPPAVYRTNVEGSRDLLRAAAEAGATRIVYTSSVATLGLNADHSPADEETPVTEAAMIGHYKRSKYLAEEAVRALVRDEGVPAVIVNPSAPIGPRDIKPTPTGRIIVDIGERYILGGENLSLREILECLARPLGRRAPRIRLSHRVLTPVAAMGETWARLAGGEPRLTRDSLRMARKTMFFSSAKAERTLGYSARPASQALADALRWFQANGYV